MGSLTYPNYLVPGNHDVGDKDNPTVPSYIINDEYIDDFHTYHGPTFQSFDHGDIHFVIINSLALNSGLTEETEQRNGLEDDLDKRARHLNSAINTYGTDITTPAKKSNNDWTTITFHSSQTSYCLHLPHTTDAQALQMEPTTIDLTTGVINILKLPEGTQYLIVKPY